MICRLWSTVSAYFRVRASLDTRTRAGSSGGPSRIGSLPLNYLGWQGKQVRDVLFVEDMLGLLDLEIHQIAKFRGEVFNLGGGAANSISLREAPGVDAGNFLSYYAHHPMR